MTAMTAWLPPAPLRLGHGWLIFPDSKVHGANMGPIWGRHDPDGSHVGAMKFPIWVVPQKPERSNWFSFFNRSMMWLKILSCFIYLAFCLCIILYTVMCYISLGWYLFQFHSQGHRYSADNRILAFPKIWISRVGITHTQLKCCP